MDDITDIDRQLADLINRRRALCQSQPPGGSVRSMQEGCREQLANAAQWPGELTEVLAEAIVAASSLERIGTRVAYLGPRFSYSYLATRQFFGRDAHLEAVVSIAAAFDDVVADRVDFAVVPIENSTDGRVSDTLSRFAAHPVPICGEVLLPIQHCLLAGTAEGPIDIVASKPQALSQCRNWLAAHLPSARIREVSSTTAAAEAAAADPAVAAIASYEAGVHYGLHVRRRNVADAADNVTRFAVIGSQPPSPTGRDKTTLLFQTPHRSGALAAVMRTIADLGINLTWIESFPVPGNRKEYQFFVDCEGHKDDGPLTLALAQLSKQTDRLEWLGSYPAAQLPAGSRG